MKRKLPMLIATAIVAVGLVLLGVLSNARIPPTAGGMVDMEVDTGKTSTATGQLNLLQQLSHELTHYPQAHRFRIISRWSDCNIWGKRVIVYDRSTGKLLTWWEGHNVRAWLGKVSCANYEGVTESVVRTVGGTDADTWRRKRKNRAPAFDFLLSYGCTKAA